MKKILLVLLALFSLVGLTACNNVKAKELDIDGSEADEDDLEEFADGLEEYLEENEFENQWYSLSMYLSISADEYLNKYEDYKKTVEVTGVYYYSKFAYDQKIKLTAEYLETYNDDGEEVEIKTELTFIHVDGKSYFKEVKMTEDKYGESKMVTYSKTILQNYAELAAVMALEEMMFNPCSEFEQYTDDGELYQTSSSFAGEKDGEIVVPYLGVEFDGLVQSVYEYDKKTYQLKHYETYCDLEYDEIELTSYIKFAKKTFGFVSAPSNPEKYN